MVLVDNRKDFAFAHNDQFFTVDFDGVAASVLAEYNSIANLHSQGAQFSARLLSLAAGPEMEHRLLDLLLKELSALTPEQLIALRAAAATGLSEAAVVHNTFVTNVPGPAVQFYFCGALQVDSLSFGPLMPNVGLFHIIYSNVQNKKGTISISITACRDMMPDPAFYAQCLQDSFDELKAAALGSETQ